MNIQDLYLIYERVICKCYNCERGAIEEADAIIMDGLYGAFSDYFSTLDSTKWDIYQKRCHEMSDILTRAIGNSKILQSGELKSLLENADIFGIIFVLGQMYQDLSRDF